jgi:hypothetical protein
MFTALGKRVYDTNPLWLIGAALVAQLIGFAGGYLPAALLPTMGIVMVLAYLQNTTYGLQSRSANRNSNAYHAIAALAANFTFFWSLQLLVRNELPPVLLAPYVFATILGTLHGNAISMKIETFLGLSAEGAKGRPQLMKLWPTVAVLTAALVAQIAYSEPSFGRTTLVVVLALTIIESFAFSMLRVARSTDHYWFHTGAVLLNLGIGFLKFLILIQNRYDWALFLPTTTGSIIGSLVGANYGQEIGKKLKASFDAHVTGGKNVVWPVRHLAFVSLGLVLHIAVYRLGGWKPALVLLLVSAWQAVSFTMVSRARQRNSAQYLAWCSVFSNGVWYICMHYLAMGKITLERAAPYIVGNAAGSLIGQNLAMQAEKLSGAVMDERPKAPKPVAVEAKPVTA